MAKKSISNQSISWQIEHFKKVVNYIDDSRKILAMICIEKNNTALEDYEHYGFLIDVIDHAIVIGKAFLQEEDSVIKSIGGKKELDDTLKKLKAMREKDAHAGDEDITLGHWDNLTPEQLAKEIEKVADKE